MCVSECVTRRDREGRGLRECESACGALSVVMYVGLSVFGGMMGRKEHSVNVIFPTGPPLTKQADGGGS